MSTKYNFYVMDRKLKLVEWMPVSKLHMEGKIWQVSVIALDVNKEGFLLGCGLTGDEEGYGVFESWNSLGVDGPEEPQSPLNREHTLEWKRLESDFSTDCALLVRCNVGQRHAKEPEWKIEIVG